VSFRTSKWICGLVALLLLAIVAAYTWWVFAKAPSDIWAWGHQLTATFFSVAFTGAIAVWLYAWQTERANAARRMELRIAQYISVFDIWDRLKDENLQNADLPDGSVEKVLLTLLQPTIFEESIRSGLFGASDTALLSRLTAAINVYNDSVVGFLPLTKSITSEDKEHVDSKQVEVLRNTIDTIQANRDTVVELSKVLLSLWSFEELSAASAAADSGQVHNPEITQLVAQIQEESFRISPGGYRGALYAKLEKAKEAAAEDKEAACASLDEIVKQAQDLSDKKITPKEAEQLISDAKAAKKELGCS
jgi:hypothetical protein